MAIALSVELKHLVTGCAADLETFLESFLGLELKFLDTGKLGFDLAHLETEISACRVTDY